MNKKKGTVEMKTLEELGISPAPWTMERYSPESTEDGRDIKDANKQPVGCTYTISGHAIADARLIAAAPELYEALRKAVIDRCHLCGGIRKCKNDEGYCYVTRWRKALENAGGAE